MYCIAGMLPKVERVRFALGFMRLRGSGRLWLEGKMSFITSPFFVVPLIAVVFIVMILFGTSSKEDGYEKHGH